MVLGKEKEVEKRVCTLCSAEGSPPVPVVVVMVRHFKTEVPFKISAEELWELRDDLEFPKYCADMDDQVVTEIEQEESKDDEGNMCITRKLKQGFKKNPVPKALRGLVDGNKLGIILEATWRQDLYDEVHALKMKTTVLGPLKIEITGEQWAVPSDTGCVVHSTAHIRVNLMGMGGLVEMAIVDPMRKAFEEFAQRE